LYRQLLIAVMLRTANMRKPKLTRSQLQTAIVRGQA
jgi:hypothetical protein